MHCLLVHRVRQSADEMELYHRVRTFRLTELISASYTVIQVWGNGHRRMFSITVWFLRISFAIGLIDEQSVLLRLEVSKHLLLVISCEQIIGKTTPWCFIKKYNELSVRRHFLTFKYGKLFFYCRYVCKIC